jgi:DNA-binding response OmpR family regulator
MKVLLVDDHPLILAALQTVIRGIGATPPWSVSTAPPRRAPRCSDDDDYDLVLLDLALGDADGFDVLVELRQPTRRCRWWWCRRRTAPAT